jgi:hypothetical protein
MSPPPPRQEYPVGGPGGGELAEQVGHRLDQVEDPVAARFGGGRRRAGQIDLSTWMPVRGGFC